MAVEPKSTDQQVPRLRAYEPLDLAGLSAPVAAPVETHLYIAPRSADGLVGERFYLCTLPAGALLFPYDFAGYAFIVTPTAATAGLSAGAVEPKALTAWQTAVATAPFMRQPAATAVLIRTNETASLTAETLASARSAIWATAPESCLTIVSERAYGDDEVAPLPALPVGPGWLIRTAIETEVRGVTADKVLAELGLEAAESAATQWAQLAIHWLESELALEIDRARTSREQSARSYEEALQNIAASAEGIDRTAPHALSYDPLMAALALVGESQGIQISPPPRDDAAALTQAASLTERTFIEHFMRIAQSSHFRFRLVSLTGSWWKEEGPPLLAFDQDQKPLALLPEKTGYRRVDPQSGDFAAALTVVDAENADEIRQSAFMLYATFPQEITWRSLVEFSFRFARTDAWWMAGAALAVALLGLLVPVVTGILVNRVIPNGQVRLLLELVLVLIAVAVGSTLFRIIQGLATARVNSFVDLRLQPAIWDRVMGLPSNFFRQFGVGDLALRVLGIKQISVTLSSTAVGGILAGIMAVTNFFVMAYYDFQLTIYAALYAIAMAIILGVLTNAQLKWQRASFAAKGQVQNLVLQILDSIPKLRVAAAEERVFTLWANAYAQQRVNQTRAAGVRNINTTLMNVLPIAGTLGVFIIAGFGSERLNLGAFVAFYAAFGQFMTSALTFSQSIAASLIVIPIYDRVRPVLEAEPEIAPNREDPGRLSGQISVRDLSFRYSVDGPLVLQDITFDVEPGEFVALVGPSGAGKSTILRLLLGFEQPADGAVFYDDKDLANLDLLQVRRQIGTVLQDVGLIPGSIYENIAGAAPLTRDRVMEALEMAGMGEDIKAMPMGLETVVSEGGGNISGGQRQRLMIARVLVHKPQIIYFDEATSALDNQTQATVTESLEQFHTTRVVIAHRLSTIRGADKILVIENGCIVQQGSYEELMAEDGLFKHLAERQIA